MQSLLLPPAVAPPTPLKLAPRQPAALMTFTALALAACGGDFNPISTSPKRAQHGYVFVTSGVFYGSRFATGAGDTQCKTVAAGTTLDSKTRFGLEAPQITEWVAWLSYYDSVYDPGKLGGALVRLKQHLKYDPMDPQIGWHLTTWDGNTAPIFSNYTAIPAGPPQGSGGLRYDESGRDVSMQTITNPAPNTNVWTATGSTGELTTSTESCLQTIIDEKTNMVIGTQSWTSESGYARVGSLVKEGADWTFTDKTLPCSQQAHLYCFGLVP